MSFLGKIFKKEDSLEEQGARLVPAVQTFVIGSFVQVSDRFTWLRDTNTSDWDFFNTVAGLVIAINDLSQRLGENENKYESVCGIISSHVKAWNSEGETAMADCQKFVMRTQSSELTFFDAIGIWILWNLLGRQPTKEEAPAGIAMGHLIGMAMRDFWGSVESK